MPTRFFAGLAVLVLIFAGPLVARALQARDADYRASVGTWRREREARLRAEDGWLTVAGLFWLKEGANRIGTDPGNDIVLPAGRAPRDAGVFDLRRGRVTVRVLAGVDAVLNGKSLNAADAPAVLRPSSGLTPVDAVTLGDLTLYVHQSGNRLAIRLRDRNSALRRDFKGLRWFPIDERYRIAATFAPRTPPRTVRVPTLVGDFADYQNIGAVRFTLDGRALRLEAFRTTGDPPQLYFLFRDLTSGKETYPAVRFLLADMPDRGATTLDFNKAYNPPCAYNPYTTCPVPPPENRLSVRIPAGEMRYQ